MAEMALRMASEICWSLRRKLWGNHNVKNQVGVSRPGRHAEVVDGNARVDEFDERGDLGAFAQRQFVVGGDGIHVNDGGGAVAILQLAFDIVDDVVHLQDVSVARHFGVQRNHAAARAVVVDDQVVNTDNFFMCQVRLSAMF